MATISEPYPQPQPAAAEAGGIWGWVTTLDHKRIGILYLVTTFVFLLIGGVEALLLRVQLAVPRGQVLSPQAYNELFTMHGTTMVFLVVMPLLLGFSNYFVPLMIGARDMVFPRLNALSYWLLLFGGLMLYFSYLVGAPPDVGWFAYAPLTERPFATLNGPDYWALALIVTSVGTIATGINLIGTVTKLRAPGMTASRIPVFVWMSLVNAFIIIWAIPSLTAAQVMLALDRNAGTKFFDAAAGGDPLLWQHLFWFFGHPEVYIMVLPAFGIISEVVPVFSRKPIFGYGFVVGSGIAIAFYSFLVWAHHMFAVGLSNVSLGFFGAASMVIAIPTGIKIFSWLATMWGGRIHFTTAMLFAIAFVAQFTIGGITGVQFATFPLDWQVTDTYYIVAHFHYVLFGGTFFGIMAGMYYWFPKMTGRMLSERLGKWNFWLMVIGFNLTFFPMHIVGLMGMPRRAYTYPDLPGWAAMNLLETVGAFILAAGVAVFLVDVYLALKQGEPAGNDPWDAWTLEWATTSPPPPENFTTLPPIRSARPLYDLKRAAAAGAAPSGNGEAAMAARPRRGMFDGWSAALIGVIALISSEAFFFGALIITYLSYRNRSPGPNASELDVLRTGLFSIALWGSSGTIWMAERRQSRGDERGMRRWLVATIVLGAIFLVNQLLEYGVLYAQNIKLDRNLFTSSFYTLTGFHGAHVALGLIALSILAILAFSGRLRSSHGRTALESVGAYWHFVDAVWVVLFVVIYLLGQV